MYRNALLGLCLFVCFLCGGCEPEEPKVTTVGEAGNTLHLVPFGCSYFGIGISELAGCSIACPGSVFAAHDLSKFTASLECSHPDYEYLQCRIR